MKTKTIALPIITNFSSYRDFLRAYYDYQKQTASQFNFAKLSEYAGIKSDNFLRLVLAGQRSLNMDAMLKLARALQLSAFETQYFETLVLMEDADGEVSKKYFKARLRELKGSSRARSMHVQQSQFFDWSLLVAISVLSGSENGVELSALEKLTGFSTHRTQSLLTFLREENLLVDLENGRCRLDFDHFVAKAHHKFSKTLKETLAQQLRFSKAAFENHYDASKFLSHTFTVDKASFTRVHERLKAFLSELAETTKDEHPEQVLQLNMQLFPLKEVVSSSEK